MKICHLTSVHDPEDVRIFHKECVSLAKYAYTVFLVQPGSSYVKNNVNIVGLGEVHRNRFRRFIEGYSRILDAAKAVNADLYHFHDPELIFAGLKLKKMGKMVIFDAHENVADSILEKPYIPYPFRKIVKSIYQKIEKYACSRFDAIVTVTPTQTSYYKKINSEVEEIRNSPICPNEMKEAEFDRRALVFAGGITSQWNHHVLIDVLKDVPNCNYILCGPDNDYRRSLENLPAWSKVEYKGKIPYSDVNKVLSKCMIGVALLQPGNNTAGNIGTLGNTKIFEEMQAGLPIICTNFVLWKEFVERYNCGICVDPSNREEIKSAIEKLLGDKDLCKEMGRNGQRAIANEFNWNCEETKLLKLYNRLNASQ